MAASNVAGPAVSAGGMANSRRPGTPKHQRLTCDLTNSIRPSQGTVKRLATKVNRTSPSHDPRPAD